MCNGSLQTISDFLNLGTCIITNSIVPLFMTVATVAFMWGMITYFLNPDNEEKRKSGKSYMIWGLVGLFVMVSMWGIVAIFNNTFHLGTPVIPHLSQTSN